MAFLFVRILAVFWKGDVYMHIPDGYLSPQHRHTLSAMNPERHIFKKGGLPAISKADFMEIKHW
jgi:hypothetical protein